MMILCGDRASPVSSGYPILYCIHLLSTVQLLILIVQCKVQGRVGLTSQSSAKSVTKAEKSSYETRERWDKRGNDLGPILVLHS